MEFVLEKSTLIKKLINPKKIINPSIPPRYQFLRWELPVPKLTEFTFCLWMESYDLTHSHPIFSYSSK